MQGFRLGILSIGLLLNGFVHADMHFRLAQDNCDGISGNWTGTAKASSWMIGECVYNGFGTASELDLAGNFTMKVEANKVSGSFVCPNHDARELKAVCVNGLVVVSTEYGNLTGSYTNKVGKAEGTLTVSPGITADVSIQFSRVD